MAKLYIGDSKVGSVAVIKEVEVEKKRFGLSIDNLLGNVDENGAILQTREYITLDLTGVKKVTKNAFYRLSSPLHFINNIIADNVEEVEEKGFYALCSCDDEKHAWGVEFDYVHFPKLTKVGYLSFHSAFSNNSRILPVFDSLEVVNVSNSFGYMLDGRYYYLPEEVLNNLMDIIFPNLKELSGSNMYFPGMIRWNDERTITFSKLETFESIDSMLIEFLYWGTNHVFNFPSMKYMSGAKIFASNSAKEIHFPASKQEEIEACPNYETKWGATKATIYFDL